MEFSLAQSASRQRVPSCAATTMTNQMPLFDKLAKLLLQRVATGACQADDFAHTDPTVISHMIQDAQ